MKGFRWLVIFIIVIAIGLVATPFGMGFVVKKRFSEIVDNLNVPNQFEVSVKDYSQGWFSSTAIVEYKALPTPTPTLTTDGTATTTPQPTQFTLDQHIYHGPIIWRKSIASNDKLQAPHYGLALIDTEIQQPDLHLAALSLIKFDGDVKTLVESPKFTNYANDTLGFSIVLQGFEGEFDLDSKLHHAFGRLKLTAADIKTTKGHQQFKNIEVNYNLDKDFDNIWTGNRNMRIAEFSFDTSTNENIAVKGIESSIDNIIEYGRMQTQVNTNLRSVRVNQNDYGTQKIQFSVGKVDAASLSKFNQELDQLQKISEYPVLLFARVYQLGMQILSKGAYFQVNTVDLNTKWGAVHLDGHLKVAEQNSEPQSFDDLLAQVNGEAKLNIPASLAKELLATRLKEAENPEQAAQQMIDQWLSNGWIIPDYDNYISHITYQNKELYFNDKPYRLPITATDTTQPAQAQ